MIFPKARLTNPVQSYLLMKQALLFNEINKWFHSNLLMLNYDKTYFLQFLTKTDNGINMQVLVTEKLLLRKV